jgi:hypothetical protein
VLGRTFRAGVPAAVGSAVAAVAVAEIGKGLGAAHVQQLMPGPLIFLTVVGVAVATAVWIQISLRSHRPERLLARLVPVVLVVSWVPDVALGAGGKPWGAVATLMLAHLAVFAVAIPILMKFLAPDSIARSSS